MAQLRFGTGTWLELQEFEYKPLADVYAVVRLLGGIEPGLDVPARPVLLVERDAAASSHSAFASRLQPHSGTPAGSGLLWQASFAVPLEIVEFPHALFALTSPGQPALALPAPRPCPLAVADPAEQRIKTYYGARARRQLVAVTAGVAVATCTPTVALAEASAHAGAPPAMPVNVVALARSKPAQTPAGSPVNNHKHMLPVQSHIALPRPRPRTAPASAPVAQAHEQGRSVLAAGAGHNQRDGNLAHPSGGAGLGPGAGGGGHAWHHPAPRVHVPPTPPAAPLAPRQFDEPDPSPVSSAVGAQLGAASGTASFLGSLTASQLAAFLSPSGTVDQPPAFLIPIYKAAGRRYGVPWQVLAAINSVETDYGRNLNVSSAGAIGWMQFMPATWLEYATNADGKGKPNPYDPADAIFSAARYLAANGAAHDLSGAVFAYNHASWYVAEVLTRAAGIGDFASHAARGKHGYALPLAPLYMRQLGRTDDGLDIEDAPDGAGVYSITPGIVTAVASDPSGFGPNYPVVEATSGPLAGRFIYYGHVAKSLVHVGQHVLAGQPLAVMGHTGDAASLGHGHIEIGFSTAYGDPLNHGGASAWTSSGDAMRKFLVALSAAYGIKTS